MMKLAPWLIGLLGLGVVGYGLMLQWQHPPRVLGLSAIEVTNPKTLRRVTLRTRRVEVGGFIKTEVELPGGTWIECAGGDCAASLRAEHFELFESLREKGN